jgi:hypothetical protein
MFCSKWTLIGSPSCFYVALEQVALNDLDTRIGYSASGFAPGRRFFKNAICPV